MVFTAGGVGGCDMSRFMYGMTGDAPDGQAKRSCPIRAGSDKEMHMELWIVRHFPTEGNRQRRYVGRTDEPILPVSVRGRWDPGQAHQRSVVISGPMKRCVETAYLLAPDKPLFTEPMLRERDFGPFEMKTYEQLKDDAEYHRWIDSCGAYTPPGMEAAHMFHGRMEEGLRRVIGCMEEEKVTAALLIMHGGMIMEFLSSYAEEKRSFYEWRCSNGEGFHVRMDAAAYRGRRRCVHVLERISYV